MWFTKQITKDDIPYPLLKELELEHIKRLRNYRIKSLKHMHKTIDNQKIEIKALSTEIAMYKSFIGTVYQKEL